MCPTSRVVKLLVVPALPCINQIVLRKYGSIPPLTLLKIVRIWCADDGVVSPVTPIDPYVGEGGVCLSVTLAYGRNVQEWKSNTELS